MGRLSIFVIGKHFQLLIGLHERIVARDVRSAKVGISESCCASAARSACNKSDLYEIRLVNILKRYRFLADCCRKRFKSYGTAAVKVDYCFKHPAVDIVESQLVYFKARQGVRGDVRVYLTHTLYLRKVAYTLEQPVGYTRCPARAGRYFMRAVGVDAVPEYAGTAADYCGKLFCIVKLKPRYYAETVAQRR